jgi:hypothetical protein
MPLDTTRARQFLRACDFSKLFIEELGWDRYAGHLDVMFDSRTFPLAAVAEKRGFQVFVCEPPLGEQIPDYNTRRKIDHQVTKSAHEHLITYLDPGRTTQVWQWVKREAGKPTRCREHTYHVEQPGDALIQKLQSLLFTLEEEEQIALIDVGIAVRKAFDVEKVTKRFYDRFKAEHGAFLKFLQGIPAEEMQRWYVSVMLNRLMFIYFIQKKGFLNNDTNYLTTQLARSKQRGKDRYYAGFLCPLFFEGFARKESERSAATNDLLGKVPYLNGGLFLRHQIEELHGRDIEIPDRAFERLFGFFEEYQWHLDERPRRADNEINPDVLGYIFEKYINQKQMGAYYTKEDITGYISQNTVIPFLFDAARQKCKIAFEGEHSVWQLLQADPDRYIYAAVKHGIWVEPSVAALCERRPDPDVGAVAALYGRRAAVIDRRSSEGSPPGAAVIDRRYRELPPEIAAGLDDVSKRTEWNKPAPPEYALPTEIWREVVARRKRYEEVRSKLTAGEVRSINDLITYNLDIRQLAQDVIENCEGPELLRAFYHAIENVTVLDPTCGSGAFLFAALNVLEPLYEACLTRMEAFLEDLERQPAGAGLVPAQEGRPQEPALSGAKGSPLRASPQKYSDFRKILERAAKHPNLRYFVLKSIIINNLYGVDIMEEAVEICKLRLFLKLVAQVEPTGPIEALPDIDFNIRAGNTLVGYASLKDVKLPQAASGRLDFDGAMRQIDEKAQDLDRLFGRFREQQTEIGGEVTAADKAELRQRLKALEDELNGYLAGEYDIKPRDKTKYQGWLASHKPFHWFVEFYRITKSAGFDAVIGNPPYVEYQKVMDTYQLPPNNYRSEDAANLYAFMMERSGRLLRPNGWFGMIVPTAILGLDETASLRQVLQSRFPASSCSTYAIRPSKLFEGVDQRLCIYIGTAGETRGLGMYTTRYHHWNAEERAALFSNLSYWPSFVHARLNRIPKTGCGEASGVLASLEVAAGKPIAHYLSNDSSAYKMHYHRSPRYWIRAMDFEQYFRSATRTRSIYHFRDLTFGDRTEGKMVGALLNSSLFFFWFISVGNGRNITAVDVLQFPVGDFSSIARETLPKLFDKLMKDYKANSFIRVRQDCEFQEFRPSLSKPIIDEIDRVLAAHYGFTDEELDFIVNYDIKYRMGREAEEGDGWTELTNRRWPRGSLRDTGFTSTGRGTTPTTCLMIPPIATWRCSGHDGSGGRMVASNSQTGRPVRLTTTRLPRRRADSTNLRRKGRDVSTGAKPRKLD